MLKHHAVTKAPVEKGLSLACTSRLYIVQPFMEVTVQAPAVASHITSVLGSRENMSRRAWCSAWSLHSCTIQDPTLPPTPATDTPSDQPNLDSPALRHSSQVSSSVKVTNKSNHCDSTPYQPGTENTTLSYNLSPSISKISCLLVCFYKI